MKYEVSQRFTFEAAHELPGQPLHGHSYSAEVTVAGAPGLDGMVVDLQRLRDQVACVRMRLDHRLLNDVVSPPTLEQLGAYIWGAIKTPDSVRVSRVRVWRESVGDGCTLTTDA